ncbi:MAG: prolipoprotein diacylglyceryl transferase [Candidatus Pacebacteria bacterium]|nr:prolipoprotein diacylglyceryl transferase [Candidatus Paceibacterota bacterium]PIR60844.1 MAG: prolipoprotein diacylglyceryl transferase [Candidatus Pacebacteria bacterium CG10_big_fil_rev_8_21_14_0_10_44_54]
MFHWYGALLAIAVLVVYLLAEKRVRHLGISADSFSQLALPIVLAGFIGARFWHVATDWSYYFANPIEAVFIWQGGLSIFGGILGGAFGLWQGMRHVQKITVSFFELSDSIILMLPIGQAIGRLGNWVNQELYGMPTNLPWKIFIAPERRLSGFEQFSYYHPLFAYEAIALLVFTAIIWRLEKTQTIFWKIGTGRITTAYILFYSVLRFLLDFIRPDKQLLFSSIGVNQVLVLAITLGLGGIMYVRKIKA